MKSHLNYSEFYITNVCNYSCEGCNRFNNFKIKGFQQWDDYKDVYKKFSQRLTIKTIGIIGGEPFLNRDVLDWAKGLADIWPDSKIKIFTNGSRKYDEKLLDLLLKHQGRIQLDVSCHDRSYFEKMHENIKSFLPKCEVFNEWKLAEWKSTYNAIRTESWPEKPIDLDYLEKYPWLKDELDNLDIDVYSFLRKCRYRIDSKNYVDLTPAWYFSNTAIKTRDNGTMYVEAASDIEKAHSNCHAKNCHHFIHGKLYKCMIPYTLKEAIDQTKNIDISNDDYEMLKSYKPLTANCNDNEFSKFINNIVNPIKQCQFCPENYVSNKIKIVKK